MKFFSNCFWLLCMHLRNITYKAKLLCGKHNTTHNILSLCRSRWLSALISARHSGHDAGSLSTRFRCRCPSPDARAGPIHLRFAAQRVRRKSVVPWGAEALCGCGIPPVDDHHERSGVDQQFYAAKLPTASATVVGYLRVYCWSIFSHTTDVPPCIQKRKQVNKKLSSGCSS